MHPQLVLPLDTAPVDSFDTYAVTAGNEAAIASLRAFCSGMLDEQQIFLYGERGTGKSHLLNAACQLAGTTGYRVAYLPGEMLNDPASLDALEQFSLVCIDDLQRLDHAAEIDLFHCINRCRAAGARLLFAADRVPAALGLKLPDLLTRLSWGPLYLLSPLNDPDLRLALQHEFRHRALEVAPDVIEYVFRRFPREMTSLKTLVDQLDQASMSAQRRVTIPLVRLVLAEEAE